MILPARKPLEPHGRPLRALQISLNSPVVTLDVLPRGPASAAVALQGSGATLCIRSLRTGQTAFYTACEDLADREVAFEAALAFAESLGFLFDEDVVGAGGAAGPEEASQLWRELCGDRAAPSAEPLAVGSLPVALDAAEVLSKFRFAAEAASA